MPLNSTDSFRTTSRPRRPLAATPLGRSTRPIIWAQASVRRHSGMHSWKTTPHTTMAGRPRVPEVPDRETTEAIHNRIPLVHSSTGGPGRTVQTWPRKTCYCCRTAPVRTLPRGMPSRYHRSPRGASVGANEPMDGRNYRSFSGESNL